MSYVPDGLVDPLSGIEIGPLLRTVRDRLRGLEKNVVVRSRRVAHRPTTPKRMRGDKHLSRQQSHHRHAGQAPISIAVPPRCSAALASPRGAAATLRARALT